MGNNRELSRDHAGFPTSPTFPALFAGAETKEQHDLKRTARLSRGKRTARLQRQYEKLGKAISKGIEEERLDI